MAHSGAFRLKPASLMKMSLSSSLHQPAATTTQQNKRDGEDIVDSVNTLPYMLKHSTKYTSFLWMM